MVEVELVAIGLAQEVLFGSEGLNIKEFILYNTIIELRKSNNNVISWFHETPWNPRATRRT